MNISENFDKRRLYRGIVHEDGLPLTADNIHESIDTIVNKNDYALENLVGSGILAPVKLEYNSEEGIKLTHDIILNIQGDIAVIQTTDGAPLVPMSQIPESQTEGTVLIVGWYQTLNAQDTMRDYGGVRNAIIGNNLIDPILMMQVSKRVQFRWDVIVHNRYWDPSESISLPVRDAAGEATEEFYTLSTFNQIGGIYTTSTPEGMTYAGESLYVIPIVNFRYNPLVSTFTDVSPVPARTSQMNFIVDVDEPTENYRDGTTWFNPQTSEFRIYVSGMGFVRNTTELGFIQFSNKYTAVSDIYSGDVTIPIGIEDFRTGDVLRVLLNGIELTFNTDYIINYDTRTITLLNITISAGDDIVFFATRMVDATNVTYIATEFLEHLQDRGAENTIGHVRVINDIHDYTGSDLHTAVSPLALTNVEKNLISMLNEKTAIKDDTTGVFYRFGIDNGILYLESEDEEDN